MSNQRYVIMRRNPGPAPDEPVMVLEVAHWALIEEVCAQLGPGFDAQPVEAFAVGEVRVVQTWQCRATVVDGSVLLAEPQQLAGASQLVPLRAPDPWPERVRVDEDATRLEAAFGPVPQVVHLVATAHTAERAYVLAKAEAQRLADEG